MKKNPKSDTSLIKDDLLQESADEENLKHDAYWKGMLAVPLVAKDFLANNLPEAVRKHVDLDSLELKPNDFVDKKLFRSSDDVIFSASIAGSIGYIIIICDHQSSNDPMMAHRIMKYTMSIIERHIKESKGNNLPMLPFPLVYPLIAYNGKDTYTAKTKFSDLFADPELAQQFLAGYQLLDFSRMPDEEIAKHKYSSFIEYLMKYIRKPNIIEVYRLIDGKISEIVAIDRELATDLLKMVFAYTVPRLVQEQFTKENDLELQQLLTKNFDKQTIEDIMVYNSFAQRIVDIVEQKIEQKGLHAGIELEKRHITERMLKENDSVDKISRITNLTQEQIEEIKRNLI